MAITVTASPTTLSWSNFTPQTIVIDPNDGTEQDCVTRFNYSIPDRPPRTVDGQKALAETFVISITPNAQVRIGAAKTAALLRHEQLHYDVGIVTARALARELMRLRAPTVPELAQKLSDAVNLHFERRAGLIQTRYDRESRHSQNAHYQGVWERAMATCLGDPRATHILGWWL